MPLYGEQGDGRGALGIPGACAEPVQSAETRSSGLRVVAEVANQMAAIRHVKTDLLRVRGDCFFRISDVKFLCRETGLPPVTDGQTSQRLLISTG
jgi:hypothetical protein